MFFDDYVKVCISLLAAVGFSYSVMPVVMWLAKRIGAIDVPKDNRRMHNHPIPRLGGLAIIFAFILTSIVVLHSNPLLLQILPGAVIIAALGIVDDIYALPAWPKFFIQCVAAGVAVAAGVRIDHISGIQLFGIPSFSLGIFAVPLTIIWIVGITNSVNFIDGLDGLAAGVSTISSLSMLAVAVLKAAQQPSPFQISIAVITAALAGGCIGVLPYNLNPAKIFIGDTGATFLGYVLSIISVQGLFKYYTTISFAVPFLVLGLPILDETMAIIRRVIHGKSPFSPDRSHLHHKLIDLGLSQKQAVAALYSVSMVLGIVAVISAISGSRLSWLWFLAGVAAIFIIYLIVINFSKKLGRKRQDAPAEAGKIPERKAGPQ